MIAIFYRVTNFIDLDYWTDSYKDADAKYIEALSGKPNLLKLFEYKGDPVRAFIGEMNKIGGWCQSYRVVKEFGS